MTSASKRSKRKERKAVKRTALLPLAVQAVSNAYDEVLLYGHGPWIPGRMILGMIPDPKKETGQGFTDRQVAAALAYLVENGTFARRQEGTAQAFYRRRSALEQLAAQAE